MKNIFERLHEYFEGVALQIISKSKQASTMPNKGDSGTNRESAYEDFIRTHAPNSCEVKKGGFIFGENGDESKQIDLMIINNNSIRFNIGDSGINKCFSFIEGVVGAVSVKSYLNKNELFDSLDNLSSIPNPVPFSGRVSPMISTSANYDPLTKVIFAYDGLSAETIISHLNDFYASHHIPNNKRPNIIHVLNKYIIVKGDDTGMVIKDINTGIIKELDIGEYGKIESQIDIQGMMILLSNLQKNSWFYNNVKYDYLSLLNKINTLPRKTKG